MLGHMRCLKFIGNQETLIFGLTLWRQRSSSSHMNVFVLGMDRRLDFGRINGLVMPLSGINILHYTILPYKGDTIAKVLKTSPPNVSFISDLVGPRPASWNALLQRLD
jgi:hypothetical protein